MASTELSVPEETAHRRVDAYLAIARAKFLALPVALVALGSATAASAGYFDAFRTAVALVGLVSFHVAVNALNEYSDYQRGIDTATEETPFSGGSGTLPEGRVEPQSALYVGLLALTSGTGVGAYFLFLGGADWSYGFGGSLVSAVPLFATRPWVQENRQRRFSAVPLLTARSVVTDQPAPHARRDTARPLRRHR